MNKKVNEYRVTLEDFLDQEGYESADDYCDENQAMLLDSVQPALCIEGCEVEPDGRCQHGCPSISLALGII